MGRELITKILNVDPSKRPTIDDILNDHWLRIESKLPESMPVSTKFNPLSHTYMRNHMTDITLEQLQGQDEVNE